jgi:D-alanyl-D-alanine carboxypeptidase
LVEAGELALEDKIKRFLSASIIRGLHIYDGRSYGATISIAHLLSHTSGLADNWAHPDFLDLIIAEPQRRWKPEETIEFVKKNCKPKFRPGDGFQYSDPGYNLLGLIIEEVTGTELHVAYREMLLDRLGMEYTYRPSHETARPRFPDRGPSRRYLDDMECTLLPAVMTADWAGGGLISTAEDLLLFMRAFVRNQIFKSPTTMEAMFQWVKSGPFHNYGLGISRVLFDKSHNPAYEGLGEIWGHTGSSDNFMVYWPEGDMITIGTLNQINCTRNLYDNIALIIRIIQDSRI